MIGKIMGYISMLVIFSFVLFTVLFFSGKLPESWSYIHIFLISVNLVLSGKIINFWLKNEKII